MKRIAVVFPRPKERHIQHTLIITWMKDEWADVATAFYDSLNLRASANRSLLLNRSFAKDEYGL